MGKLVNEVDKNYFDLLKIVNSVHVSNSLSVSILFSSRNKTFREKTWLLTDSKYYVILDTQGIIC